MNTPTPDAGVRRARPQDADALGEIHARAWQCAYRDLLPARAEAATAPVALAAAWRTAVEQPPSAEHRVLVATAGADLVGFVALSPATDADAEPGVHAEVLVLLIDPDHVGSGHGSRLLNAAADTSRERGYTVLRSWVPEPDHRRLEFLGAAGFAPDGASRVLDAAGDGTTVVREIRLVTLLPSAP